jgi:RNA-directed DNA polymerase
VSRATFAPLGTAMFRRKPHTTLSDCLQPGVFAHVFAAMQSDPAPWRRGEAPVSGRALLERALALVEDLRAARYRADAMHHHTIAKACGGTRVISSLCKRDKFAQKLVALGLEAQAEQLFHHDSYGYRPKRSVEQALARARERIRMGLRWLVDADIQSFFDRIAHSRLSQAFARFCPDPALNQLIAQWLSIGTYSQSFFDGARGIPQGAVISPLLCNLYLHPFDQDMSKAGLPFVRYADDFLLFAPDEKAAHYALNHARRSIEALGLSLKPEKTRVVAASKAVIFLGQGL